MPDFRQLNLGVPMGFGVKALGLSHSDREMESEVGGKEVLVRAGVCRANLAHV